MFLSIWIIQGKREMHAGFWRGNMKQRGHLVDIGIHVTIILKCILNE